MVPRRADPKSRDRTTPCPWCGYRIPPDEILRVSYNLVNCPKCHRTFDDTEGKKPVSKS